MKGELKVLSSFFMLYIIVVLIQLDFTVLYIKNDCGWMEQIPAAFRWLWKNLQSKGKAFSTGFRLPVVILYSVNVESNVVVCMHDHFWLKYAE